jgi:hypothetical protein
MTEHRRALLATWAWTVCYLAHLEVGRMVDEVARLGAGCSEEQGAAVSELQGKLKEFQAALARGEVLGPQDG